RALAIQPDGKIVVGGYDQSAMQGENFALLRYDRDGELDAGFGIGGIVTADFFGRGDIINGLALAPGGRIIAAGTTDHKTNDFIVAVYKDDGSPDTGFGINGKVTTSYSVSSDVGNAIALGTDGSIVVAGAALYFNSGANTDFAIARYEGFPGGSGDGDTGGPTYNLCLEDETTGDLLKLNSQTGEYQFRRCGAQPTTLVGRGKMKLKKSGCLIKLSNAFGDREVKASINTCKKSGSASVRITGQTFTITDNDMSNNSCACP
ncbi:MAG TPA: delta-60 repeat domain-containing protein, partial [Blastocatellia bacterium]